VRSSTKRAGYLLLLCAVTSDTSSAQRPAQNSDHPAAASRTVGENANRHDDSVAARLLSLDDGLSILGAALESRVHVRAKSDCSHLVHAIYERAGFPYPYVSSSDLYIGIGEFRRVARPQPGDLVVWPGHVGIAISSVQRSFYSALHSGFGVEIYDAPYWRARGRARFYRYVKAAPATVSTASTRTARLTPSTFGSTESHDAQEEAGVKMQSPTSASEVRAVNLPIPRVPIVESGQPSAGEITAALSQAFTNTAEALREKDVLALAQPLIVFDRFEIEGVRFEREEAYAAVRIRRPLPVTTGQVKHGMPPKRQQWLLRRRAPNSWEVVLPQEGIYLPREAAIRVLAHQLAVLTDDPEAPSGLREKAQLARLLNTLLE